MATLATLILVSYTKVLEICFKSVSVGILEYPDSSNAMLWLPDATVKYLSGNHIPLFSVGGSGSPTFQCGKLSGGQGIQKYKVSLKPTTHLTLLCLVSDWERPN